MEFVHRKGPARAAQKRLAGVVSGVLALAASGFAPSHAAEQPGASGLALEEIVVTARKREENIQTTPVAVTAFSEESLDVRSVSSIEGVAQFVPNLQFDGAAALSGGGFNATVFIRGIGQNDFATFSDTGVGIYVDGVYLGRTIGGIMDATDIQRVEILRGPQGTLFGRNTIGGAVNIVSKAPREELAGDVTVTAGQFNRRDVRADLDLPLADGKLLTRITGARLKRDGYAKQVNYLTGEVQDRGDQDQTVGRLQTLWKGESLSVSFNLDGTRIRQHAAPLTLVRVAAPSAAGYPYFNLFNNFVAPTLSIVAPNGQKGMNSSWITGDPYTTFGDANNVNNLDSWGTGLTLDWTLGGGVDFKSISAYRRLHAMFGRDGDNSPYKFRQTFNDDSQRQFSQEFQLSGLSFDDRLNWLLGAYYFKEHSTDNGNDQGGAQLAVGVFDALQKLPTGTVSPPAFPPPGTRPTPCDPTLPGPPCLGGANNPQNIGTDLQISLHNVNKNESYALFSQATFKFTDQFSITPGIRYTRDHKIFTGDQYRIGAMRVYGPGVYTIPTGTTSAIILNEALLQQVWGGRDSTWSQISPKLSFEYQVTQDMLFYLSVANGYKSGGFNERPLGSISEVNQYDPEKVWTYEAGAKTSWFDRRVIVNGAVFYNDYKDIQLTVNATPRNFVANAARGRIEGAELEATARVAAGFDVNLSAGYLSARYTEIAPCSAIGGTGQCLPITLDSGFVKAPKWTMSSGAQYTLNLGGAGTLLFRGDWTYKSFMFEDVGNDPAIAQPGFSTFNARARYTTPGERWEFALFGTNLGDKRYRISGNAASAAFGSLAESTFAPPREWGVSATAHF